MKSYPLDHQVNPSGSFSLVGIWTSAVAAAPPQTSFSVKVCEVGRELLPTCAGVQEVGSCFDFRGHLHFLQKPVPGCWSGQAEADSLGIYSLEAQRVLNQCPVRGGAIQPPPPAGDNREALLTAESPQDRAQASWTLTWLRPPPCPCLFRFLLASPGNTSFKNLKWQPPPVFMPGKSHGPRSLVGYSPWDHKESDTTD